MDGEPQGSPQGASVSPLLANVYLHYVLDLWADWWRRQQARGDVIIVRFADDFIVRLRAPARMRSGSWHDLRQRFARFGLELHPGKTRLIEFGRFAAANRAARGPGKPETFDFLGFTHICGKTRERAVLGEARSRSRSGCGPSCSQVKDQLRQRMHQPIPEQGRWLASVVRGHMAYYAVPGNDQAVAAFRDPDDPALAERRCGAAASAPRSTGRG